MESHTHSILPMKPSFSINILQLRMNKNISVHKTNVVVSNNILHIIVKCS